MVYHCWESYPKKHLLWSIWMLETWNHPFFIVFQCPCLHCSNEVMAWLEVQHASCTAGVCQGPQEIVLPCSDMLLIGGHQICNLLAAWLPFQPLLVVIGRKSLLTRFLRHWSDWKEWVKWALWIHMGQWSGFKCRKITKKHGNQQSRCFHSRQNMVCLPKASQSSQTISKQHECHIVVLVWVLNRLSNRNVISNHRAALVNILLI